MIPSKQDARNLLEEAYLLNPGPWKSHSIVTAECAYKIALYLPETDENIAYIYGLLHDIGRRFGFSYMRHVIDGYHFLVSLGYEEPARICLTHSFAIKNLNCYIGKHDVTQEQKQEITEFLKSYEYNDYDRLIQVCDSIAMPEGPVDMEIRMKDVKKRYGSYPEDKWNKNLQLKTYFEKKTGHALDKIVL